VTPIGQQNQPGPLQLLVLHGKTGENTEFDFARKISKNLDAAFTILCKTTFPKEYLYSVSRRNTYIAFS
jgi:hypothetical protein